MKKTFQVENPLLIIFSDLHIARSAWVNSGIDGDSEFALYQVTQYAKSYNTTREITLISPGDFLEQKTNPAYPVQAVTRNINFNHENYPYVQFLFIQGNHEFSDPPWLSSILPPPASHHIHNRTYSVHRGDGPWFKIFGLDFQTKTNLNKILDDPLHPIHAADMVVCHQGWEELVEERHRPQGSLKKLKNKFVVTGDYHVTKTLNINNRTKVLSPGSCCIQDMSEDRDKYFFVFDVVEETFTPMELVSRPFISLTATNEKQLVAILNKLPKIVEDHRNEANTELTQAFHALTGFDMTKPIVRVSVSSEIEDAAPRLKALCEDRVFLSIKFIAGPKLENGVETTADLVVPKVGKPIDMLDAVIDHETQPEAHEVVSSLLTTASEDPFSYLKGWWKKNVN